MPPRTSFQRLRESLGSFVLCRISRPRSKMGMVVSKARGSEMAGRPSVPTDREARPAQKAAQVEMHAELCREW